MPASRLTNAATTAAAAHMTTFGETMTVTPHDGAADTLTVAQYGGAKEARREGRGKYNVLAKSFMVKRSDFTTAFGRDPEAGDKVSDGTNTYYIDRVDIEIKHCVLHGWYEDPDGRLAAGEDRYGRV